MAGRYLVCDDYSGYKARFKSGDVIEVGCMAHARRKFHELHVTKKSQVAEQVSADSETVCHRSRTQEKDRWYSRTAPRIPTTA